MTNGSRWITVPYHKEWHMTVEDGEFSIETSYNILTYITFDQYFYSHVLRLFYTNTELNSHFYLRKIVIIQGVCLLAALAWRLHPGSKIRPQAMEIKRLGMLPVAQAESTRLPGSEANTP